MAQDIAQQTKLETDLLKTLAEGLRSTVAWREARFDALCDELLDLLEKLDEHGRKEADLFQEAFEQDRGV